MSTYISIVKSLVKLGYLPAGTDRKSKVRKSSRKAIMEFMQNMGFNLLINNVPEFSVPRDSTENQEVTEFSVFETLAEFGYPHCVLKVTPNCYFAYALDADSIKDALDGMCIDDNTLKLEYNPIALPLAVNVDNETDTGNYDFTRVLLQFFFIMCLVSGIFYYNLF